MSGKSYKRSLETRRKMSEAQMGHPPTFKGPHTLEVREKLRAMNLGKKRSEEVKEKIRAKMRELHPGPRPDPKPKDTKVVCDECGKVCKSPHGLRRHHYYMHTEEGRAEIRRPRPAFAILQRKHWRW